MRSSVSYMLSTGSGDQIMSHPDYDQQAYHHGSLLVLVRGIGPLKPRSLQKIFERIQKVNNIKIKDSSGYDRDIWVRYVRDHPIENNDWGDFQTHRRLLGLITVGKFETQNDLNELCRVHESLKVKYTQTIYDSRSILFAPPSAKLNGLSKISESIDQELDDEQADKQCPSMKLEPSEYRLLHENELTMPTVFKSRGFFYAENDHCQSLEANMAEFISSLFWILEHKRLERSKEKFDKVSLLLAPFEKKDFVGLDMESRNNKKRCMGRITKNLADLTLQCGLLADSLNYYHNACETLRAIGDSLWLGSASEGLCAVSAIYLYPELRNTVNFQRNTSLHDPTATTGSPLHHMDKLVRKSDGCQQILKNRMDLKITLDNSKSTTDANPLSNSSTSSASSIASSSSAGSSSLSSNSKHSNVPHAFPTNILQPDEITSRYRDAIINYSKYRNAGIIETEAALKAARICVEQNQNLDVAMFLQNVLYINLNMNELERVKRFETLTDLYQRIGYNRKAAFCQRLAAWRHIAQSNTNPDWGQSYRLMLDSFPGHKLCMEPNEVLVNNQGWPCLQIDLIQQLVGTARRLGQSALATRHMTFLLQTMWKHLSPSEQKEMAMQLQSLSSQCEGAPVPLVLENGTVIPPSNLTDLPYCISFQLKDLAAQLRPQKIVVNKADNGPFLFTPIHYNSSIDRRTVSARKRMDNKLAFNWVQHDLCEIVIKLENPLPFELQVNDMRLLTNGIVFESLPQSILLPPNQPTCVSLHGTPLEIGELEINGYSTHTLGVKSNCRLKNMLDRSFPSNYLVNVIPALPKLDIKTSLPQTASFGMASSENVITSASLTLFNGEAQVCEVTLVNTSAISIEFMDCTLHTNFDSKLQARIFRFDIEEIREQLPIKPNGSITFKLHVFGDADFIGPVTQTGGSFSGGGPQTSSIPPHHEGPSSGGINSLLSGIAGSRATSRVNSPVRKNNELNSSFRSTSTSGTNVNSGHSSLATLSLGGITNGVSNSRQLDAQLRFRYSGADSMCDGFCRTCALSISLELMPSAQITNWDVLPAEVPSQFYLVLDVINLTAQEMSLNYTTTKTILIEAKESCRVPVPVERCPLDRILLDYNNSNHNLDTYQKNSFNSNTTGSNTSNRMGFSDLDLPERLCSEHIANQVNLKWQLPATELNGVATLRGISLSPTMIDLVTVAPLQWDVKIDNKNVAPQSEVTCTVGQSIDLEISICNLSTITLQNLVLSVQFYQDFQNGIHNYRLETRVTMSGANQIIITSLNKNERASHDCSVLFFTAGRFKVDIQCKTQQVSAHSTGGAILAANDTHHTWKFIPPIEITVVE